MRHEKVSVPAPVTEIVVHLTEEEAQVIAGTLAVLLGNAGHVSLSSRAVVIELADRLGGWGKWRT